MKFAIKDDLGCLVLLIVNYSMETGYGVRGRQDGPPPPQPIKCCVPNMFVSCRSTKSNFFYSWHLLTFMSLTQWFMYRQESEVCMCDFFYYQYCSSCFKKKTLCFSLLGYFQTKYGGSTCSATKPILSLPLKGLNLNCLVFLYVL